MAEHDAAFRAALMALLSDAGAVASFAQNGAEAVQAAASQDFDAILMQLGLPVLDGLAATRALRALEGARACTPIVALAREGGDGEIAACAAAGMDGHVARPLRADALLAVIRGVIAAEPVPQRRAGAA